MRSHIGQRFRHNSRALLEVLSANKRAHESPDTRDADSAAAGLFLNDAQGLSRFRILGVKGFCFQSFTGESTQEGGLL